MATLQHPDLGEVKGNAGDGVEQYLGIPFATLKDRLSPPELKTHYDGVIEATRFGSVMACYTLMTNQHTDMK